MHSAAVSPSKGAPLKVIQRKTPSPGPNDLLIEVHSVALNPIDYYQRDFAMPPLKGFPAVLGSDIGGVVVSAGSSVSTPLKPGTRVTAFAPTFFVEGAADYGAFQKFAVIPAVNVSPIPDSITFNEASIIPMSVVTTWSGIYSVGLPRDTHYTPADKQGFLVWGGASSVGSAAVQVAHSLGFTVYVAASEKHAAYLKTLGAHQVFDYKDPDVEPAIIAAANSDDIQINWGYDAVGQLPHSSKVLLGTKGVETARLASATPLSQVVGWYEDKNVEGIEVKFVSAPPGEKERDEHMNFIFNIWLKDSLEQGTYVPSPEIKVVEGGLNAINKGLDQLRAGVSGVKLVLEI